MIELLHVSKSFTSGYLNRQTTVVLRDISLTIPRGGTLGLVGESGSGKTTLGRVALMLAPPTQGTVRFNGTDLTTLAKEELRKIRPSMQIVFQDPDSSLNPRLRIGQSVAEPLEIWGLTRGGKTGERVAELLELVGLSPDLAGRYPFEISGGQKQRVALARALALEPSFLVADEPTAALDLSVQAQVISLIKDIQRRMGLTLLFISHDLEVIRQVSDRVAVLHAGELVEIQPTADLFRAPEHPYTAGLVAASQETDTWFGKR